MSSYIPKSTIRQMLELKQAEKNKYEQQAQQCADQGYMTGYWEKLEIAQRCTIVIDLLENLLAL